MAAILPRVFPQMLDEVHAHQDAGRPTFIVSAAGNDVVESLAAGARHGGRDRHPLRGRRRGQLHRPLRRALRLRPRQGRGDARPSPREHEIDLAASYAYSDSLSDLPMLRAVGNPVAVNPDPPLAAIAKRGGLADDALRAPRPPPASPSRSPCWRPSPASAPRASPPAASRPAASVRASRRLDSIATHAPRTSDRSMARAGPPEFKQRDAEFSTISGQEIEPLYTEEDLDPGLEERVGQPGEFPFTRGPYPSMYRGGSGRCASSPASAPSRRPTSASTTCSTTARPGSRPPSTCRP